MCISKLKGALDDPENYSKDADASEGNCVPLGDVHIQVADKLHVDQLA
jgi:hypothetical protein